MFVYRIYDVNTQHYWYAPDFTTTWPTAAKAEIAWDIACNHGLTPPFREQWKYVIHEFTLVRVVTEEKTNE